VKESDRPPLFEGLPHVCFVNTNGSVWFFFFSFRALPYNSHSKESLTPKIDVQEMRRPGTQSYQNEMETRVAVRTIQALVLLGVSPIDIGIISLCK
jgi:hypothetical protein